MRVLVTGGTGFVGSNLALALHEAGHTVIAAGSVNEQRLPEDKIKTLYEGMFGIDWEKIGNIDALFHEGAIADTTIYDRDEMVRANVETSEKLFRFAAEHGVRNIVYATSTAVYGGLPAPYREDGPVAPLNPYGESKVLLEKTANTFAAEHPDIRVVGLRYCNVYGPRENHKGKMASMVYQLARQMQLGDPKIFKHGEQKREFVYIDDVVKANMLALQAKENCVVNCANGHARSFNELVAILNTTLGLSRKTIYIDNPFAGKYQNYIECDISLAKDKLGFTAAFQLEEGVKRYYDSGFLTR